HRQPAIVKLYHVRLADLRLRRNQLHGVETQRASAPRRAELNHVAEKLHVPTNSNGRDPPVIATARGRLPCARTASPRAAASSGTAVFLQAAAPRQHDAPAPCAALPPRSPARRH